MLNCRCGSNYGFFKSLKLLFSLLFGSKKNRNDLFVLLFSALIFVYTLDDDFLMNFSLKPISVFLLVSILLSLKSLGLSIPSVFSLSFGLGDALQSWQNDGLDGLDSHFPEVNVSGELGFGRGISSGAFLSDIEEGEAMDGDDGNSRSVDPANLRETSSSGIVTASLSDVSALSGSRRSSGSSGVSSGEIVLLGTFPMEVYVKPLFRVGPTGESSGDSEDVSSD